MRVVLLLGFVAGISGQALATDTSSNERLEIIDRAIAFHGGEIYSHSRTSLSVCSRSGCFEVESEVDGDRFVHSASGMVRGVRRKVVIDNDRVQLWENGTKRSVSADEDQGLRDWVMARVYFPFLPYRLNDPSVFKQDQGLETWNGRSLRRVKVTFTPGSSTDADDEYLYWLDPQTGQVEQLAYSYQGRPGGLRFRRAQNYRRVGGLLFFDQVNLGAEGAGLSVDQIDPEFVSQKLRPVSVVELKNIEVHALD